MKILYAAGNRSSSGDQFKRIKEHLSEHEIKFAAFSSATQFIQTIDFVLDYFYSFWHDRPSYKRIVQEGFLTKELEAYAACISNFAPDLLIADQEPLTTSIAKLLEIPIWYCSPVHLIGGCPLKSKDVFYKEQSQLFRMEMTVWPKADRIFIYSPFSRLKKIPINKEYEWVEPYSNVKYSKEKDLNIAFFSQREKEIYSIFNASKFEGPFFSHSKFNSSKISGYSIIDSEYDFLIQCSKNVFCAGETSIITDALNNNSNIIICPNLNDVETTINASMMKIFGIGRELGQIELMGNLAVDELNNCLNEEFSYKIRPIQQPLYLHEIINKG